jgi:hypothetical protein
MTKPIIIDFNNVENKDMMVTREYCEIANKERYATKKIKVAYSQCKRDHYNDLHTKDGRNDWKEGSERMLFFSTSKERNYNQVSYDCKYLIDEA